jgi:predicted restriction endonuclease
MLLAVLDLAKAGGLEGNKIYLNPELVERYIGFFKVASMTDERPNPHYPFFYLRGKLTNNEPSFWHLHPIHGRELSIESLEVSKASDVSNNIEYASLDSELFELLQDLENIERFEESLTRYWQKEQSSSSTSNPVYPTGVNPAPLPDPKAKPEPKPKGRPAGSTNKPKDKATMERLLFGS